MIPCVLHAVLACHYLPRLLKAAGTGKIKTNTGQALGSLLANTHIPVDAAEQLLKHVQLLAGTNFSGYIDPTQNFKMMDYISTILQDNHLPATGLNFNFSEDRAFVAPAAAADKRGELLFLWM
jgi:hypothetical protein